MSTLKPRFLVLFCITFCLQYFFSQTKVYDVKETTLHLQDSIVYLRSTMTPISGIVQVIDTNKKKVFEASFISGKKSGNLKLWLSNGQLIFSGNYLKGLPHGSFEWYYSNGKIKAKCNYIEGDLNGKCQGWYEEHDQLKYEENYKLGALFGVQRYFSEDGVSLGGGDLINGTGKLVLYYENNIVAIENSFSKGKLNHYIEYSRNGMVLSNVTFTKDNCIAEFWKNENKIAHFTIHNGVVNGARWLFHDNGKISQEEYFKNGQLDSIRRFWYANGKQKEESIWDMGQMITVKYWNEKGESIADNPSNWYYVPILIDSDYGYIKLNMTHSTLFKSLFKDEFEEIIHSRYPSILNNMYSDNYSGSFTTASNPFGVGGGHGGGIGPFDGNGKGTGGEGEGVGYGRERIRINDPVLPKYKTDTDLKILLKLTVSGDGSVTEVVCVKNKTTTTDQTIINDVINQVKRQVKYTKDPEGISSYCYLTVKVKAQ